LGELPYRKGAFMEARQQNMFKIIFLGMRKLVAAISGTYGERFLCHILLRIDRKYDKASSTVRVGCSIGTALMASLSTQSWRAHS